MVWLAKKQDADGDEPWRKRYYEETEQLERGLQQSRAAEDDLRRLAARLCLAAQGQTLELDRCLDETLAAIRSQATTRTLNQLISSLGQAIESLDAQVSASVDRKQDSSPSAQSRMKVATELLIEIIDRLDLEGESRTQAGVLRGNLYRLADEQQLHEAILNLADILKRNSRQANERAAHFRALLKRVTHRLDEVTAHLVLDRQAQEQGAQSSQALNDHIQREMQALNQVSREAQDLNSLQRDVEDKISRVDQHLVDFRARERELAAAYRERSEHLQERVAELEQQAVDMASAMQAQRKRALTDALTGIPNRSAYSEHVPAVLKQCQAAGDALTLAIWDIDEFKAVNDAYGHQAGDKAIQLVARHLHQALGDQAFTARVGGEEFVTVLARYDAEQALPVLQRVRAEIAQLPFHHANQPVPITVSCGVTHCSALDDLDAVYGRADTALYEAKRGGRNQVRIYAGELGRSALG